MVVQIALDERAVSADKSARPSTSRRRAEGGRRELNSALFRDARVIRTHTSALRPTSARGDRRRRTVYATSVPRTEFVDERSATRFDDPTLTIDPYHSRDFCLQSTADQGAPCNELA